MQRSSYVQHLPGRPFESRDMSRVQIQPFSQAEKRMLGDFFQQAITGQLYTIAKEVAAHLPWQTLASTDRAHVIAAVENYFGAEDAAELGAHSSRDGLSDFLIEKVSSLHLGSSDPQYYIVLYTFLQSLHAQYVPASAASACIISIHEFHSLFNDVIEHKTSSLKGMLVGGRTPNMPPYTVSAPWVNHEGETNTDEEVDAVFRALHLIVSFSWKGALLQALEWVASSHNYRDLVEQMGYGRYAQQDAWPRQHPFVIGFQSALFLHPCMLEFWRQAVDVHGQQVFHDLTRLQQLWHGQANQSAQYDAVTTLLDLFGAGEGNLLHVNRSLMQRVPPSYQPYFLNVDELTREEHAALQPRFSRAPSTTERRTHH